MLKLIIWGAQFTLGRLDAFTTKNNLKIQKMQDKLKNAELEQQRAERIAAKMSEVIK